MMSRVVMLPLFLFCAASAVLGAALASQYIGGLVPCELCLLQRWPYGIVIALGLIGLVVRGERVVVLLGALACLAFLAGAGIAAYHAGVECGWWQGPSACTNSLTAPTSIEELRKLLEATQVVRCDQPAWTFAGISMAGFNVFTSLALAGLTAFGVRRLREGSR